MYSTNSFSELTGSSFFRGNEQRMSVGLGLRREIGADIAAGAGLLLDDDRLAPLGL
jgi:hypothetical protein